MRGLNALFNRIMQLFRRSPDMGQRLQPTALEEALKEARFLRSHHAVDVKKLAEGEKAGPPKRADTSSPESQGDSKAIQKTGSP